MSERAFDPLRYVAQLKERLIPDLQLELESTPTPGGDGENTAHVRSVGDHLQHFVIEYDSELAEGDLRIALLHEMLHIVLRHVAQHIQEMEPGIEKRLLTVALEEDTEAHARRTVREYAELGYAERPRMIGEPSGAPS